MSEFKEFMLSNGDVEILHTKDEVNDAIINKKLNEQERNFSQQVDDIAEDLSKKTEQSLDNSNKMITKSLGGNGKIAIVAAVAALATVGIVASTDSTEANNKRTKKEEKKAKKEEKKRRKYGLPAQSSSVQYNQNSNMYYNPYLDQSSMQMAKDISTYRYGKKMTGFV